MPADAIVYYPSVAFGEAMTRLYFAYGRLRCCLTRLARQTRGCLVVQGLWTQPQLAELAGCCRETAGKIVCELTRGGRIGFDRRRITFLRPLREDF
jgi:hypothetical protein